MRFTELGVYLDEQKTLIIADLHLGYEHVLNKEGLLIPRFQHADTTSRLQHLLKLTMPRLVIINGDLKHDFGPVPAQQWRSITEIIRTITGQADLVIIKGNHDSGIEPLAASRGIRLAEFFIAGSSYVCHGHRLPGKGFRDCKTVIIGHEHPAVTLTQGARSETYKCYLQGRYLDKQLVVLPSFNPCIEGSDVLGDSRLSPLLKDIRDFKLSIVSDRVYDFQKLEDLR